MPAQPSLQRVFLGWERPLLQAAVDWVCEGWSGGPLDLGALLAVVPTAQAGRRLRAALAERAAASGSGVLSPAVITPEVLLAWGRTRRPAASPLEALGGWVHVLGHADPAEFPDLFPAGAGTPVRDPEWALGAARRFVELRELLGERGLTIAEAAKTLGAGAGEAPLCNMGRWSDLSRLEGRWLEWLERFGLADPNRCRRDAAATAEPPPRITRVAMIAVPDPQPLALEVLARWAERLPVSILIHAPAGRAADFDEWGRPGAAWQTSACCIDLPDSAIHLLGRPQDQARKAVELLRENPDAGIGVVDRDVLPHLQLLLRETGVAAYDPGGTPLAQTAVFELLALAADLAAEDRFETGARLLRLPEVLAWLRTGGVTARPTDLLAALDTLQNRHLPASFVTLADRAREAAAQGEPAAEALAAACRAIADLIAPLRAPEADREAVMALLGAVYGARSLDPRAPGDRHLAEAAAVLAEGLEGLDAPALRAACPSLAQRLRLLLAVLGPRRIGPAASEGLELDGWLELHWNPAPALILTGVNEGRLPESVVGHAFLPDAARKALGLLHNDRRLGRDAYLLTAMLACRPGPNGLHVIVGKTTRDGDALRPSRLLFRCADADLPARALRLFRSLDPDAAPAAWHRAWTLRPPRLPPPDRISVTAFRDYLRCPFRFYLRHVVGMERLDDRKSELDPMDFGVLCHAALEALAGDPGMRDADDPDRIAAFLVDQARRTAQETFGPDLPAAVIVQLEAACQRLRAAAAVQARQRAEGWRILHGELRLGDGRGVPFHGLRVHGRVDRVDRHEDGRLRILDYKTGEKPEPPEAQHLGPLPRTAEPQARDPLDAVCQVRGRARRWQDLQLPLYRLLLEDAAGPVAECAYFALPKAVTETAVLVWEDFSPELLESARRCAAACAEAIRAGRFWPPADRVRPDDFEDLFFGDCEASIDPECVPFLMGRARSPAPPPASPGETL